MVAQTTVTFDATKDKGSSDYEVSKDGVTIKTKLGALKSYKEYRFYKGSTVTISSTEGKNITKVVFTCTANNTTKNGPGCFTNASTGSYTYSYKTGTWTGNANWFTLEASSNQVRATKIEVTVSDASLTATETSFATPSYTFTLGSDKAKSFSGQKATVKAGDTELKDAKVTYSLDPSTTDLATIDNDGTVHLKENKTGTVTVKAKYAGDDTYLGSEASYTITIAPKTTGDGTEANPYTVADVQLLNTNNELPISQVYVKGIVSKVGNFVKKKGQLSYYISDDGTTTSDQLYIYNGSGQSGDKFTAATDLETGWTVTVQGTLLYYNNKTLELTDSKITKIDKPVIATPVISGSAYFLDNTTVTITCDDADAKIYYTLNGSTPTTSSNLYSEPFTLSQSGTVTAVAFVGGKEGKTASQEFKKVEESDILTVAQALDKADNTVVFVKGKVASTQKYDSKYPNLNYFISDDGTASSTLEVFRGTYLNNAYITSNDQIVRGDEVIVVGTVTTYDNKDSKIKELAQGSTLLKLTEAEEKASISDAGWATYVTGRALDFTVNKDVTAYAVKFDKDANTITLNPVEKVPAQTAVVLKGNKGDYTFTRAEGTVDALTDNDLSFYPTDFNIEDQTTYVLANHNNVAGFYPLATGEKLPAYKGYIEISGITSAKSVYSLDDNTTGISSLEADKTVEGQRFNLAGQRVSNNYKGVVIMNGKKFIVK